MDLPSSSIPSSSLLQLRSIFIICIVRFPFSPQVTYNRLSLQPHSSSSSLVFLCVIVLVSVSLFLNHVVILPVCNFSFGFHCFRLFAVITLVLLLLLFFACF